MRAQRRQDAERMKARARRVMALWSRGLSADVPPSPRAVGKLASTYGRVLAVQQPQGCPTEAGTRFRLRRSGYLISSAILPRKSAGMSRCSQRRASCSHPSLSLKEKDRRSVIVHSAVAADARNSAGIGVGGTP